MKSLEQLHEIREGMKKKMRIREHCKDDIRIVVGMATCGINAGARTVLSAFIAEAEKKGLNNVKVSQSGCIDACKSEPVAEVFVPGQEKVTYIKLTEQKAKEIIEKHIILGKPIAEYMFK